MNVVVPLYRTALNPDEWLSLERCFAVLGGYPITFVIPEGLDMTPVMMRFPSCRIESFDPSFFCGTLRLQPLDAVGRILPAFSELGIYPDLPDGCFCLPGRTGAVVCPGI